MTGSATILRADARALPLANASVDAVVCDPPYSLSFMGREWDSHESPAAFQAWCEVWAAEAYRVLEPGGHMLAFGGTRTWHRLVCAIEDAGFEIRDSMAWLYGSGFPKSLDVSKAIDRQRDDRADVLKVTEWVRKTRDANGITNKGIDQAFGTSGMAGHWTSAASQPAVPTLEQVPTLLKVLHVADADVPTDIRCLLWDLNGRKGQPGEAWLRREVIETRQQSVGFDPQRQGGGGWAAGEVLVTAPATDDARRWQGWGTALKPGFEPIVVARKPLVGTVAANVLQFGTGAINIDACRIEGRERTEYGLINATRSHGITFGNPSPSADFDSSKGRWPTNVVLSHSPLVDEHGDIIGDACADGCVPGCPVAELDAQSGVRTSGKMAAGTVRGNRDGWAGPMPSSTGAATIGDSGGASRFFPTFRYEAKAPDAERPRVNGVAHPTVKPLPLIRFLCRLVTQPGGRVLDMFGGSGTTAEAALLEGFDVVVSENWEPYLPLIRYRLERARCRMQPGITRIAAVKPPKPVGGQGDLFADLLEGTP